MTAFLSHSMGCQFDELDSEKDKDVSVIIKSERPALLLD